MGTSAKLEALFAEGRLSEMLAREFHGKIGRTEVFMKDCEFMMEFESEEKTPQAEEIGRKVIAFYRSRGFRVEVKEIGGQDYFLALIHPEGELGADDTSFVVNITTNYPLDITDRKKNFLRTTCLRV